MDAGYGRKPTLQQTRALADERALSDALATALRSAKWNEYPSDVAAAQAALRAYDAARSGA